MKIVLIYPPNDMHNVSYNLKTKKFRRYGHQPPLGIGYVAAIAERNGHEVVLVDGVANGYSTEECAHIVKNHNPDMVGISVMTHLKNEAGQLAKCIKHLMPQTPIIMGGSHAHYFHEDILKEMPDVDFVLYGEIETTWEEFLLSFNQPESWKNIKGLCYRDANGNVKLNDSPEIIRSLDALPFPSWHLYDFSLYEPLPFQRKGHAFFSLIASRGCVWGKCAFCYEAGRKKQLYRQSSPERVVSEMKILHEKYGIDSIAFWDDTFPTNLSWLKKFVDLLEKESLRIHFTCSTKVSFINKENVHLLKKAGCWSLFLGIESGDEDLLEMIDKGITLSQVRNAVKLVNEAGIETRCAFMLGLPGETPEKAKKTLDLALELDSTYAIFYATHPRYGTKLYDIAMTQGNFLSKEFRGMTGITYVPDGYKDEQELQKTIRNAYFRFYLRPKQILKYIKKIHSFNDLKEAFFALELFLGLKN